MFVGSWILPPICHGLNVDFFVEEKVADDGKICNDCNVHHSTVSANGFDHRQFEEDKVWNNHKA
jgi:hypothetical protein